MDSHSSENERLANQGKYWQSPEILQKGRCAQNIPLVLLFRFSQGEVKNYHSLTRGIRLLFLYLCRRINFFSNVLTIITL